MLTKSDLYPNLFPIPLLNIEPGDSYTFNIVYLRVSIDVTPGSYDLTLHVEEIH